MHKRYLTLWETKRAMLTQTFRKIIKLKKKGERSRSYKFLEFNLHLLQFLTLLVVLVPWVTPTMATH